MSKDYDPDCFKLIADAQLFEPPEGLRVRNVLHPDVERFTFQRRRLPVTEIVAHESVTYSANATVRILNNKRCGVHFMIREDGLVIQHNDPVRERLRHCGGHNDRSVGIEVVNPYYGTRKPWSTKVKAPWAHRGFYVLPRPEQLDALALLIGWLTDEANFVGLANPDAFRIPRHWIGMRTRRRDQGHEVRLGGIAGVRDTVRPGIYAHHYTWEHADGAMPVLYTWMRLVPELGPEKAYELAVRRATNNKKGWVLVEDLVQYASARAAQRAAEEEKQRCKNAAE